VEILIPMVLISLALVAGAIALFVWTVRQRTFDHADRLALLPLEEDEASRQAAPPRGPNA